MTDMEIVFKYKQYQQNSGYTSIAVCEECNKPLKLKRKEHWGNAHFMCGICRKEKPSIICSVSPKEENK